MPNVQRIMMNHPDTSTWPDSAYEGFGKAWLSYAPPTRPEQEATVRAYIVHAPQGNQFWPWYLIASIHLREIEGTESPHKRFPEASHEFMIAAVNPDDYGKLHPGGLSEVSFLTPIDLVHQVGDLDDDQAAKICDSIVRAIVVGGDSPDQDFRSYWIRSIDSTAHHFRTGVH